MAHNIPALSYGGCWVVVGCWCVLGCVWLEVFGGWLVIIGAQWWLVAVWVKFSILNYILQDGTGPLQFVKNGVKIDGSTYILDSLHAKKVTTDSTIFSASSLYSSSASIRTFNKVLFEQHFFSLLFLSSF